MPCIAKSDSFTTEELRENKIQVSTENTHSIWLYFNFSDQATAEAEQNPDLLLQEQEAQCKSSIFCDRIQLRDQN